MRAFVFVLIILCSCAAAQAAVGVYNITTQQSDSNPTTIDITYRLNCVANVGVEILDSSNGVVAALGAADGVKGLNTRQWDAQSAPAGVYRARITATCVTGGEVKILEKLFGTGAATDNLRGVAVDRCPQSPGYGTIYLADIYYGKIFAYNPDGSKKMWPANGYSSNALALGLSSSQGHPWGLGVDNAGNIYTTCKAKTAKTGVKVFDWQGYELHHLFPTDKQDISWVEGRVTSEGLEVFETIGSEVRMSSIVNPSWTTIVTLPSELTTQQICFEASGNVFYLVANGKDIYGPGVFRYIEQSDKTWAMDTSFDCPIHNFMGTNGWSAARVATGVSCNTTDPDGDGPHTATCLWIGLAGFNSIFGGNAIRMALDSDSAAPELFRMPGRLLRFVAADAVGNVVAELNSNEAAIYKEWGLLSPCGEANTDVRVSSPFVISGSVAPEIVSGICECKQFEDGQLVELGSAKIVTAVFDGCFYIQESQGPCGIKVESETVVGEGSVVRVRGTMGTNAGERVISGAQVL